MTDRLEYRSLSGSVEYSAGDRLLYGRILDVRGLVSYEGRSVEELEASFREAVDEFLSDVDAGVVHLVWNAPLQVSLQMPLAERAVRFAQSHHLDVGSLVEQAVERFLEQAA